MNTPTYAQMVEARNSVKAAVAGANAPKTTYTSPRDTEAADALAARIMETYPFLVPCPELVQQAGANALGEPVQLFHFYAPKTIERPSVTVIAYGKSGKVQWTGPITPIE